MGGARGQAGKNGVRQTAAGRSPAGPGAQPPTPDPCSPAPGPGIAGLRSPSPDHRCTSLQSPTPDPRLPCPFCDLAGRELVAENALAVAFRDGYPVNAGHTLIVPRRHVVTWFDATREEQIAILELADRVKAELDTLGVPVQPGTRNPKLGTRRFPDGYNLGLNCGPAAGQTVMHLHMHVIPRYRGDHPSPKGGVRWIFPKKAKYWHG